MNVVGSLVGVLILIGVIFYVIEGDEHVSNLSPHPELNLNSSCLLNQSECVVLVSEDLQITVSLAPHEIVPLERFMVSLTIPSDSHKDVENVLVWVEGRDMDMGRHLLTPQLEKSDPDREMGYFGMIPVCTVDDKMVWRLVLRFSYLGQDTRIYMALKSINHGA